MKLSPYLKNLDSLIAAIIGYYAIYLFTSYSGVGLSPDSIMYASTATNLQAHGSILTFNKTPLVFFPVFYPFFLGVIQFISRFDPITAGSVTNSCLFAAVIFTTGWILENFTSHARIYKWLILIAIILSPGLLEIYSFLWSETLFIFESLLFIIAYRHYLQTHTTKALLIAAFITAITCITRYAGITIVGTGCLMLLLDNELPIKKKIKHMLIYGFVSISLLVANLVMNRINTGLSTGTREPSITPFIDNLHYFGTVICDWAAFRTDAADPYAAPITSIIFICLIGILAWKTYKRSIDHVENIVIAFAVVYGLFIVISASISRYERINSRLIAPMFIPLLIACTSWVPDVLRLIKTKAVKYALSVIAVILMMAFEYSAYQVDYQRYDDECDYGVPGYSDDSWNKSEFVVYLRKHQHMFKPGIPIYSDADEAVYLFTGMSSTLIPHKLQTAAVQKFYGEKRFYLIWFDNLYNSELISLPDIMAHKKLVKVGSAKEGEIYYYDESAK
jgi:hypothetical protein